MPSYAPALEGLRANATANERVETDRDERALPATKSERNACKKAPRDTADHRAGRRRPVMMSEDAKFALGY
jgi:hypothetical protein